MEVAQFIDSALSENGKVFVNCVFGRSRYLVTVIVLFTIITIIALAEAEKLLTFSGKNLSGQKCHWKVYRLYEMFLNKLESLLTSWKVF